MKELVEVIAKALDVPLENLGENLFQHPMGRIVDGDICITSADQLFDDGSISYFSRIYNQTKVLLLEPDDLHRVWKETAQRVSDVIQKPSFSISIKFPLLSRTSSMLTTFKSVFLSDIYNIFMKLFLLIVKYEIHLLQLSF